MVVFHLIGPSGLGDPLAIHRNLHNYLDNDKNGNEGRHAFNVRCVIPPLRLEEQYSFDELVGGEPYSFVAAVERGKTVVVGVLGRHE